jgi:(2R)-sulfolactate sulfo-lyase subunit alpha
VAVFLIHRPGDSVGVAAEDLERGTELTGRYRDTDETVSITALDDVPYGHKVAITRLSSGDEVIEYGVAIGRATVDVEAGSHVHVHNLKGQRWA